MGAGRLKQMDVAELCAVIEATGQRVYGPVVNGSPALAPAEIRELARKLGIRPSSGSARTS